MSRCIWNGLLVHNSEEENGEVAFVDDTTSQIIELRVEVVNEITAFLCHFHPSACAHLIKEMCKLDLQTFKPHYISKYFTFYDFSCR